MGYSKIALLTFGAGFALGLLVVVVEIGPLARVASGLMALGLLGIPIAIAVDACGAARTLSQAARKRAKTSTRRNPAVTVKRVPRWRKPAARKR